MPMFLDSYSFTICDTSNFSEYVEGGVATEVKQPEILHFVSVTQYWFIFKMLLSWCSVLLKSVSVSMYSIIARHLLEVMF